MADLLVIHPDAAIRLELVNHLRRTKHTTREVVDLAQARALMRREGVSPAVVIAAGEGECANTIVRNLKTEWPVTEVIVTSGTEDLAAAADAIRHGPFPYVAITPLSDLTALLDAVQAALLRRRGGVNPIWRIREEDASAESFDPVTRDLVALADRVALVNSTVLITGETGTGKEVLARRIHRHSSRCRQKFVPVNCGCLPESLVETELFGYKKGAFTGATTDTRGLIEEADHGILFLDEVGDMPGPVQVRLLRFLDRGEIRAVGGTSVKLVDVRIIAATNKSLQEEVKAKRFREDLYFRLSVVTLHLPALRDRKVDISHLVRREVQRTAEKLGVKPPAVTDDAMALLVRYSWPGNIRELQNVLEYAIVRCSGDAITSELLPSALTGVGRLNASSRRKDPANLDVLAALRASRGNQAEAAAALGISRTTLWRRLKQLGEAP